MQPRPRHVVLAALADAAALLLFAAAGRRSHDEGDGLLDVVETAAPFLLGVAVAWLLTRAARRPLDVRAGVLVWAIGVPLGLVLRRLVFDRGIAFSFVLVALAVTGVLLVGWRLAARLALRRRAAA